MVPVPGNVFTGANMHQESSYQWLEEYALKESRLLNYIKPISSITTVPTKLRQK
jgi:hypothetical protein